jgi:HEAT repeat protein
MPTEEQRARLLLHYAWDLRDEGLEDAAVVERLVEEGVPRDIAGAVPGFIDEAQARLVDDDDARRKVVQSVAEAVASEDFDALREAMLGGVDDDRTLHKVYDRLSELLVSESHEQGTVAAYGLSFLIGLGDWPLIEALSHADENVRYRSAFALGKMGKAARHAIPPLEQALSDPDDYVRMAAEDALTAIRQDLKPWWKFW